MENEGSSTICPLDPSSRLILSGDGFEPAGVLFPHVCFHFPSKDKKEAYNFMDKVRAMESDPFQWEWRNLDCVAKIPHILRMYLRARGQVPGPVNAPVQVIMSDSEEDDDEEEDSTLGSSDVNASANHSGLEWNRIFEIMAFNHRCSESMPDFSRVGMIDEDIPNVSDRGRSPLRNFRSQIRAPCALIKDLSSRDQEIAMAFIKAFAAQHQKRSSKKKKLRKKINQMLRRVTVISRELHTPTRIPGTGSSLESPNLLASRIV
ncbi:hypothetical protein AXX17_ATUG05010 [Arabidopsis thaliana]|uniref:Uncharacterized protein n=1 Tax=Arabidopsis thaliana TaxID=3702 RepID=A0A178U604_ARATH|nr:hypothetical protein AXX17_ATUG05010 [Arabidopsis thaliana]